ncbi:hypothetical protein FD755_006579 [Muntiacus reevesi]|uniref:Uncharacterized protein n=1 Tax=Muntiacus reevesi TaxID=9886 RepID=A0A5J5MZ04_MUNRE|nr:hypothetical protein FD755_006579 [Muntiacus reevesi]
MDTYTTISLRYCADKEIPSRWEKQLINDGQWPTSMPRTAKKTNYTYIHIYFPRGSDGKAPPTPVLLPGKSHGQRSLVGYSPWGHKESDMTERLHFHFTFTLIYIKAMPHNAT